MASAALTLPRITPLRAAIAVATSLVVWTLANLDQSLFGYAIPGIMAEFHVGIDVAGLILAISFVSSAFLVVLAGLAADRFGRAVTLALLLGGSAVFVGLQGFVTSIAMLTLLRSISFGLSGGLSPITNAIVVENVPDRLRGLAIGLLQCGYPLGWFLASLLAVPLLQSGGWRGVCTIAFAVIPFALIAWWLLRGTGRAAPAIAEHQGRVRLAELFTPEYRRLSIASMVTFFAFGGAYAGSAFFFTSFFVSVRGYTDAEAAGLVGMSNGIALIGYLGAAIVGEYWLTRRTVFVVWILAGALALLGLLWLPENRWQDGAWYALMASLFYGAAAVFPVLVAEIFPGRIRATALAVCGSMPQCLGFAVFPLIVPAMVGWVGWQMALSLVVTPTLIVAALTALLLPNRASGLKISH